MVNVPTLWPSSTIVCIASGPSLTAEDCARVRGRAPIIAINDAVRLVPDADVLYSSDASWWKRAHGAPNFLGLKFAIESPSLPARRCRWPGIIVLRNTGDAGLETSPSGLRTGRNSGYAAINLAVHLGATRVVLLGYDMGLGPNGRRHFCEDAVIHPSSPFESFRRLYQTLVEPLKLAGVQVVNCSRATRLTAFRRAPIEDVLASVPRDTREAVSA